MKYSYIVWFPSNKVKFMPVLTQNTVVKEDKDAIQRTIWMSFEPPTQKFGSEIEDFCWILFQRQTLQCAATIKPTYKFIFLKGNTILSCQGYSPFWNSEICLNNSWSHYSPDDSTGHKRIRKQKEKKKTTQYSLYPGEKCWMRYCHKNPVNTFISAWSLFKTKHSKLKENMKLEQEHVGKVVPIYQRQIS